MAVGFIVDDLKVKVRGRGKINKSRAGKLVYPTCKRNFQTLAPVPEPDPEAPCLHMHNEEGLIVSKKQVVFIQGFTTQAERETAAAELGGKGTGLPAMQPLHRMCRVYGNGSRRKRRGNMTWW